MAFVQGNSTNDLTKDEISRFNSALACPEFRQLLVDYVQDVTDPKNRAQYENEVKKVEKEKGYDVTFVHPEPCYVVKTQIHDDTIATGPRKVFINIASNENVDKPGYKRVEKEEGGMSWTVPHAFSPPREDLDKKGLPCTVVDCVFHPDALKLAKSEPKLKEMIENIAMDGIETNFKIGLDRLKVKYPKMMFKGPKVATLMRKTDPNGCQSEEIVGDKPLTMTPEHYIKYRHHFDIQDYAYRPNSDEMSHDERQNELVIEIKLPLIGSSEEVQLDVQPNVLFLKSVVSSPHFYDLELKLPCAVLEDEGTAKFDLEQKTLTVVLPTYKENKSMEDDVPKTESQKEETIEEELSNLVITNDELENNQQLLLPDLSCHQDDHEIVFVLKTENVASETMKVEHFHDGMACQFRYETNCSFEEGEVPIVYSLFLRFPCPCKVEESATSVSINEDSVVVIFKKCLTARHNWTTYFYDIDGQQELKEAKIEVSSLQESLNALWNDSKKAPTEIVANPLPVSIVEVNTDRIVINIKFDEHAQVEDESEAVAVEERNEDPVITEQKIKPESLTVSKRRKQRLRKLRSVSESSDDLSSSPSRRPRGILKHSRRKTLSESSDDFSYSSSLDYTTMDSDIPEEEGHGGKVRSTAARKSVHFNNVVMKNVFRLNSIISNRQPNGQQLHKQKKKRFIARRQNSESSEGETMGSSNEVINGTKTNLNTDALDNLNGNVENSNVIHATKRWPKNDNVVQSPPWRLNQSKRKTKRSKKNVITACGNNNKSSLSVI